MINRRASDAAGFITFYRSRAFLSKSMETENIAKYAKQRQSF